MQERVADLEAYVNNSARNASTNSATKIPGPGPGHNAWQMTSTALVLFMTLPGLALFYGGLVRSKNVLSVMAQCLGIAGLVTILWWICGYSLAFGAGAHRRSHWQPQGIRILQRRGWLPTSVRQQLDFAQRLGHVPADVRHHHAGADHRCDRGAHEVLRHSAFRRHLDVRRLFSARPHGLGGRRFHERRTQSRRLNQGD